MMMNPSSNAQNANQKNMSVSLALPTSQQETAPMETKVQPLQIEPVQVAHVPLTKSLAPPDDFLKNLIMFII